MNTELTYKIAVSLIPGIGPVLAKNLIAYCGSPDAIFTEKIAVLKKIPGIGDKLAAAIKSADVLNRAEEEVRFILKNNIRTLFYLDSDYPHRLKECSDAPIVLFYRGNDVFDAPYILSIVGTRNATEYGKTVCNLLIEQLASLNIPLVIVSGLAYGIDICAHKASIKNNLPTVASLAHGLDRIYPGNHASVAKEMLEKGALVTEFLSQTNFVRENFLRRNRIIAGLADATLVIESAVKGGALVTADIAHSYDRDVLAVPGSISSEYSKGCNFLIKNNKAALIESADDIISALNWNIGNKKPQAIQQKLFVELSPNEEKIRAILMESDHTIDSIFIKSGLEMSKISASLLEMEFKGLVKNLPGKVFSLTK
ncbi:MAG TPA: DNA-protecting protein DprA [Bacteroidales bacterium]|nr:DNA-protecting protein DprA [Bacteroidales bacterium]